MKRFLTSYPVLVLLIVIVVFLGFSIALGNGAGPSSGKWIGLLPLALLAAMAIAAYVITRPQGQPLFQKRLLWLIPMLLIAGLVISTVYRAVNVLPGFDKVKLNPEFDLPQESLMLGLFFIIPALLFCGIFTSLIARRHRVWVTLIVPPVICLVVQLIGITYIALEMSRISSASPYASMGSTGTSMLWMIIKVYFIRFVPVMMLMIAILNILQLYFRSWTGWLPFAIGCAFGMIFMIGPASEYFHGFTLFTYNMDMQNLAGMLNFEADTRLYWAIFFLVMVLVVFLLLYLRATRGQRHLPQVMYAEPENIVDSVEPEDSAE